MTTTNQSEPAFPADQGLALEITYVLDELFKHKLAPRGGININADILYHTVISYMLDIGRMQTFHAIAIPDRHKRAAFLMAWIVKMRPIQLNSGIKATEGLLLINEIFAIHAGFAALRIKGQNFTSNYLRNLTYILHYRNVAPEVLASSMYLLECAFLGKIP